MKKMLWLNALLVSSLLAVSSGCSSKSSNSPVSSSSKEITSFSIVNPAVTGNIDANAKTIFVTVPRGTNSTTFIAEFSTTGVKTTVGNVTQISGVTPNDFTNPVVYTVTAQDGSTELYTVTVTESGSVLWAKSTSASAGDSEFYATTTDTNGNIFAAGDIEGTVSATFGDKTVTGVYSGYNALLIKYNPDGSVAWATTPSAGSNDSSFSAVAADSSGNIYAAGYILGTSSVTFGSQTLTGISSGENAILVKYASNGSVVWARTTLTSSSTSSISSNILQLLIPSSAGGIPSYFNALSIDASGNVYAVGKAGNGRIITGTSSLFFGDKSVALTVSFSNALIVKYSPDGSTVWAQAPASTSDDTGFSGVTADSSGNIYAAGYISGTGSFTFGDKTLSGAYSVTSAVLVKYASDGSVSWARTPAAADYYNEFYSVAADANGNVYAAGFISGTGSYTFGDKTVSGTSSSDNALLVKYASDGSAVWAKSTTAGTASSDFYSIAVDAAGSIFAVGYTNGTLSVTFGDKSITGIYNGSNALLVKYGTDGTAIWAQTAATGSNTSWFDYVTLDAFGNLYVSGQITGSESFTFGSKTVQGAYSKDANGLLIKYRK